MGDSIMKKKYSVFIALICVVSFLTIGCGESKNDSSSNKQETVSQNSDKATAKKSEKASLLDKEFKEWYIAVIESDKKFFDEFEKQIKAYNSALEAKDKQGAVNALKKAKKLTREHKRELLDMKQGDTINNNFELSNDIRDNMSNYAHWYSSLNDSLDFLIRSVEGDWDTIEDAQDSCTDRYRNCREMFMRNLTYLSNMADKYNIKNDADLAKKMKEKDEKK